MSAGTHKASGGGEEQPAVLDERAGAIADHVLDVVIETVGTCNQGNTKQTRITCLQ